MVKTLKKLLSIVLIVCMIMSMLSVTALADTQDEEPVVPAGEEVMEPAEGQDEGTDASTDGEDGNSTVEGGNSTGEDGGSTGGQTSGTDETDENGENGDKDDEVKYPIPGDGFEVDVDAAGVYVVTFTGTGTLSQGTVDKAKALLGDAEWTAVIGSGITEIAKEAFNTQNGPYDMTLTGVEIGVNVETIGKWAFWGCAALESVTFADGSKWTGVGGADAQFQFCTSLTHIDLPANMTRIPAYCFAQSGLTSINVPSKVQTIGKHAFKECHSLTTVTLPEGVKTIEELAFKDCEKLTGIELPSTLKTIGVSAFQNCEALVSIRFPEGLEQLGVSAFESSGVTKAPVVLPESLEGMGDFAFSGEKFTHDVDKVIYYEGYTVYGFWSHSRVFCLNGGSYSYEKGIPISDKGDDHKFVGWHRVTLTNADELEKIDELDESSLVRHTDGTLAGLEEVGDTVLFPAGSYYFAEWSCKLETAETPATCTTPGKVVKWCTSNECGVTVVAEIPVLGHEYSKTEDATKTKEYTTTDENGVKYNVVEKYYPCIRNDAYDCVKTVTQVQTYTVTYRDEGKEDTVQTYYEGDTINLVADPEKDGYTFKGWSPKLPETMPAENLEVIAQWDEDEKEEEQKPDPTNPDPDPNPNPDPDPEPEPVAPVTPVKPVKPVTPVTPVIPSLPDDEEIPDDDTPLNEEPDDEDIPDDDTPLSEEPDDEEIPDDDTPLSEEPDDEEIPDDDTPLSEEPDDEEIPDDDTPLSEEPENEDLPNDEQPTAGDPYVLEKDSDEEIADDDVPLADVPQTGDGLVIWLSMAALSGSGLILVNALGSKRKEEDGE